MNDVSSPNDPKLIETQSLPTSDPNNLASTQVDGHRGPMETMDLGSSPTKRDWSPADDRMNNNKTELSPLAANDITGDFSAEDSNSTNRDILETGDFNSDGRTYEHTPMVAEGTPSIRRSSPEDPSTAHAPKSVGSYHIKRVLGRGGMGVVYLAHQPNLNRDVALKMVLAGGHASAQQLDRFKSEARAVAQLQHPNIVQVFEVGEQDGLPFFSLEFVDGQSLDRKLDGKPIPPRDAAKITEKVCRAMQYAHDRGVLHRDLKPANILLTRSDEPKVTDFGLAKQLDDDESASTRTGTIMGTPSYMSPEQAQGLVHEMAGTSDQYSLGAMLYELLTGRPPFMGTKAFDTISQVVHKEPIPPHQLLEKLPPDLDTICLKALQKSPAKRYASCNDMADDLARFLNGEPILARPVSRAERAWRWCKRNPRIAIPSALAATMVLATAAVSTWAWNATAAQAAIIADERDTAQEQRDEANKQRAIALENEEKAKAAQALAQKEKDEADRQTLLANEAKLQAEKNQQLAERQAMLALQNIQFFITEIDDRLAKQPGMSELRIGMLEVLDKKWNELDTSLAGGIQGQAIPTQMAVRFKIAQAWTSLDKLTQADKQFEAIEKSARDRLVVKNRNDATRVNLARVLVSWAPIRQRLTGDPSISELLQLEANELLREVLRDPRPEPGSPQPYEITDVLQQSLLRTANYKLKSGHLDDAAKLYQEVRELGQKIVDECKANAAWFEALPTDRKVRIQNYFEQNVDLGKSGFANVLCRQGKVDEAIPVYESVIAKQKASLESKTDIRNARDQLALQYRNYGQNMLRVGKAEEAVRLIGQSHELAEKNYKDDPTNANFKRSFGHTLYYWGVARSEAGQSKDAIALLERSRMLRQEMIDISQDQANKVNLMLSESRLGNLEAAEKWIQELSLVVPKDADLRLDIARSLAQLAKHATDETKRREFQDRAFAALDKAIADGLLDPFAISSEADLKPIREDQRFLAIVNRLRR